MFILKLPPVGRRLGNKILSRTESVVRRMVLEETPGELKSLPYGLIDQLLRVGGSTIQFKGVDALAADILLSMRRSYLPQEILSWFELTEMFEDLEQCHEVVFCSYLRRIEQQNSHWLPGFVIEQASEVLSSNSFLRLPYHAVFLNTYGPEGKLVAGFDHFRTMVHLLALLASDRTQSYETRQYYAATQELDAAHTLLDSNHPRAISVHDKIRSTWLSELKEKLGLA